MNIIKLSRQELEHRRRLGVARVQDGYSQTEVARFLGVSARAVRSWVAAYRRKGDDGLTATRSPGALPKLSPEQEFRVLAWVLCYKPSSFGFVGDLWSGRRLAEMIQRDFGVRFHPNYLSDWLRQRGLSPQVPARRPKEYDEYKVRRWLDEDWPVLKKKSSKGRISCGSMKPAFS
jgi:transposase